MNIHRQARAKLKLPSSHGGSQISSGVIDSSPPVKEEIELEPCTRKCPRLSLVEDDYESFERKQRQLPLFAETPSSNNKQRMKGPLRGLKAGDPVSPVHLDLDLHLGIRDMTDSISFLL